MKNSSKIVAMAAAAVSGFALVGIGFAAWVIGGQTSASTGGNIYVDTVVNGITLSATVEEGSSVVYGRPEDSIAVQSPWLENDGAAEQLALNMTLTYSGDVSAIDVSLGVECEGVDITAKYNECISDGIITDYQLSFMSDESFSYPYEPSGEIALGADKLGTGEYKIVNLSATDQATDIYVRLTFGWGELFAGVNPLIFFNSFSPDDMLVKSSGGVLVRGDGAGAKTARQWANDVLSRLSNTLTSYGSSSATFVLTLTAEQ